MRIGLSQKLSALVLGSCILSGIFSGVWISLSAEHEATATLVGLLERTANRYEASIGKELERKTQRGVTIAALFKDALVDPAAPREPLDLQKGSDGALRISIGTYGAFLAQRSQITPQVKRDIETMFKIGPKLGQIAALDFHNFYFEGAEGDFLFETPNAWPMQVQADENYQPYFAQVSPSQNPERKPVWKPVYYDGIQKLWMTSLRVPLYDGERFLGAAGYDYILQTILQNVQNMDRVESGCRAFLFTDKGDLVIHPDYMDKIQTAAQRGGNEVPLATAHVANKGLAAFVRSILAQTEGRLDNQRFIDGSEPTYASVRTIPALGWKLVVYAPSKSITGPLRATQVKIIAASLGLASLLALLLNFGFRRIVLDPLAALASSAAHLGANQWNTPVPSLHDDEIGFLTNSFKEMADRLHRFVLELEDRVQLRTGELLKAKEMAEATNEKLDLLNKDLRAFSYSISHDLRAPLRSIDGWSLALLEDCGTQLDEQGRGYLGRVRAETQRMGQLIDALLLLSRVTQAEMRRRAVDLSALAENILAQLRETDPERQCECRIAPGIVVQGDSRLLRAALTNLFDNAWKFTGKCALAQIEFGIKEENGVPTYFIRDNGAGFDMAYAANLFAPFQRMHSQAEFPGTGIGLATVQRIIFRHGGRLWAESQLNEGTTFSFTLPASVASMEEPDIA